MRLAEMPFSARFKKIWMLVISFIGVSLLGGYGCSSHLSYKAGLYTKKVSGKVSIEKPDDANRPFILVLDYHRTMMEMSDGYLSRVTAFIIRPDEKGHYRAPFSADTVRLELMFYAYNRQIVSQAFRRSLGIGGYQFDIELKEDNDWRNTYYLIVKPTLIEYITEKRYRMSDFDRYYIGEWLTEADERF